MTSEKRKNLANDDGDLFGIIQSPDDSGSSRLDGLQSHNRLGSATVVNYLCAGDISIENIDVSVARSA